VDADETRKSRQQATKKNHFKPYRTNNSTGNNTDNSNKCKRPKLQPPHHHKHKDGHKPPCAWRASVAPTTINPKATDTTTSITNSNNADINVHININDKQGMDLLTATNTTATNPALCNNIAGSTHECQPSTDAKPGETPDPATKKAKKNKKKKKKSKKNSSAEDGKKIFVGGVAFENCGYTLSDENETLAYLRSQMFSHIFHHFGKVKRIQGHWTSGYCFVVYAKRRDAKQAIRYLSLYPIRKKIVHDLRDRAAAQGVLPLPSFYVRWPTTSTSSSSSSTVTTPTLSSASSSAMSTPTLPSSPSTGSVGSPDVEDVDMEEGVGIGEEMGEEEVERLLRQLRLFHEKEEREEREREEMGDKGGE